MNQMSQKLSSLYDPRSGPSKIRVRVDRVYSSFTDSRKLRPARIVNELSRLFHYLLEIEATGRNNQNLRRPFDDLIPRDARGIFTLARERIHASGQLYHLRHPMAATINRIQPFHAEYSRPV